MNYTQQKLRQERELLSCFNAYLEEQDEGEKLHARKTDFSEVDLTLEGFYYRYEDEIKQYYETLEKLSR